MELSWTCFIVVSISSYFTIILEIVQLMINNDFLVLNFFVAFIINIYSVCMYVASFAGFHFEDDGPSVLYKLMHVQFV